MEQEFNLIDMPWICVQTADCAVKEVSLKEILLHAQDYRTLSGETKTQDFAVLRLLLALIHTIFSRYDTEGNELDFNQEDIQGIFLDNWKAMWEAGQFPAAPIERYFSEWHEHFWLFDEEKPFYQSNAVKNKGKKPYDTAKMIGSLFESGNKKRLFSDRLGNGRNLSYAEAARWLLHIICFDDIASKFPTPKQPWTGKLSLIALKENTLFKTLMLNYRATYDAEKSVLQETPSWEYTISEQINRTIAVPDNQAALLSLRSRNIFLYRENGTVSGYDVSGGDYFDDEAVFDEQMTLWKGYQEKKETTVHFKPKKYDTTRKAWQEFCSMTGYNDEDSDKKNRLPGVVEWVQDLIIRRKILPKEYIVNVETAAVIYDYKQATCLPVIDAVSDTLTFHAQLLTELGRIWCKKIQIEIENCDKVAYLIGKLYKTVQFADGRKDKDNKTEYSGENHVRMQFYDRIDRPFRLWLADLNPDDEKDEYVGKLETEIRRIAFEIGADIVAEAGALSIFGRFEKGGQNEILSSAQEYNLFQMRINKIFEQAGENHE